VSLPIRAAPRNRLIQSENSGISYRSNATSEFPMHFAMAHGISSALRRVSITQIHWPGSLQYQRVASLRSTAVVRCEYGEAAGVAGPHE
jgi:hypothetical protein